MANCSEFFEIIATQTSDNHKYKVFTFGDEYLVELVKHNVLTWTRRNGTNYINIRLLKGSVKRGLTYKLRVHYDNDLVYGVVLYEHKTNSEKEQENREQRILELLSKDGREVVIPKSPVPIVKSDVDSDSGDGDNEESEAEFEVE
jgi:hypothetical protein